MTGCFNVFIVLLPVLEHDSQLGSARSGEDGGEDDEYETFLFLQWILFASL